MKPLLDQIAPEEEKNEEIQTTDPKVEDIPSFPDPLPSTPSKEEGSQFPQDPVVELLPEGSKPDTPTVVGRPSIFTKELSDKICDQLAEGISLRTVCLADDMPDKATVFRWLRTNKEFCDQYTRAKEESADAMAEDVLDIADDGRNDWMTITKGNNSFDVPDREVLQRSKLRVDTRIWLMSKMKPKKYGEKLDLSNNGKDLPTPLLNVLYNNNGNSQNSGTEKKN